MGWEKGRGKSKVKSLLYAASSTPLFYMWNFCGIIMEKCFCSQKSATYKNVQRLNFKVIGLKYESVQNPNQDIGYAIVCGDQSFFSQALSALILKGSFGSPEGTCAHD